MSNTFARRLKFHSAGGIIRMVIGQNRFMGRVIGAGDSGVKEATPHSPCPQRANAKKARPGLMSRRLHPTSDLKQRPHNISDGRRRAADQQRLCP